MKYNVTIREEKVIEVLVDANNESEAAKNAYALSDSAAAHVSFTSKVSVAQRFDGCVISGLDGGQYTIHANGIEITPINPDDEDDDYSKS